jgi:hypothetical protein
MVAFLFSGSAHELTRFEFPKGRAPHQNVITAVETFYNGGTGSIAHFSSSRTGVRCSHPSLLRIVKL